MRWILTLLCCSLLTGAAVASPKVAPDAGARATTRVEEAVDEVPVTNVDEILVRETRIGTRTARRAFDLPFAVGVFESDVLMDAGRMVALKAISRRDPAIWYDERTYSTTDPIIRGFAGMNLLTLVDGNTLTTLWGEGAFGSDDMFGKIDPDSIDHIEVIFGPQSALYGSNALGAVINIITRASPLDYVDEGFAWGSRLKFDHTSAAAGFGSRLEVYGATDRVRFLIGGSYRDFDNAEGGRGLGTLDPSYSREMNFDLSAEFKLTDGRLLDVRYQNVARDPTMRYYRPNQTNRNERRAWALTYRDVAASMPWDELEARVYHQYKRDRRRFYADADRDELTSSRRATTETWQAGLRATKDVGGGHTLTAGLAFELDQGDSPDDEQFTWTRPNKWREAPLSDWYNYAIYVQDEWQIDEDWSLIGTVRYDYFTFETDVDDQYRRYYEANLPPLGDPDDDEFTDHVSAFTGGLGVVYKVLPDLRLVASYRRGFRQNPPSFGLRQLGDGVQIPGELLDPTTTDNFEVGVKGRGDGFTFEVFGYYTMIQNWQGDLRSTTFNGESWFDFNDDGVEQQDEGFVQQVEGGEAYVYGFEARATLSPNALWSDIPVNWSLWGGFAWNTGEIGRTKTHDKTEPFRHTQPMRGLLGIRWDDVANPSSGLYCELVSDMVGRFDDIPSDRQTGDLAWRRDPQDGSSPHLRSYVGTPGYVIMNIYAGVNLCDNARLKIGIENLTDRRYRAAHSRMDAPGIDFLTTLEITF